MAQPQFRRRKDCESGQTIVMVLLILGIFLLAALGFSVDYSNAYFHRQSAQDAADAACTAGIMDLLENASGSSLGNFPAGSPPKSFQCSANPNAAPCQYAARNGYTAPGLTAGTPSNDVQISFPSSCSGCPTPSSGLISLAPYPFLQVNVTDRAFAGFSGMITTKTTVDIGTQSICMLEQAKSPVPIIVLNPSCTNAFQVAGSSGVAIIGGPTRSVQVNSNNQTCAAATQSGNACTGNGSVDLSLAGPSFTGANFGVAGTPTTAPPNFSGGTTGAWTPASAINDPYALVSAPSAPSLAPNPIPVLYDPTGTGTGCPDHSGCTEYFPGLYTSAIVVKGFTAIFAPGVYYITGTNKDTRASPSSCDTASGGSFSYGFDVDSNGVVRPAHDPTNGYSTGTMFYLTGTSGAGTYGSVFFGANAGKSGGRIIDPFASSNFICSGAPAPPSQLNLPTTVNGNVLLGQCTGAGTWVGATINGTQDTVGTVRGLIFFQDRANADTSAQAHMDGGGGLVISGNLYYHNCNASGTGTGCSLPTTGFQAYLEMQGNSAGGTYVLGNITADSLVLGGNPNFKMALNPNAVYNVLKATLVQ